MHVARWWVFPGDPWQITRDASGAPSGINPAVYKDFDAALQLAEQYDLYYVFVLFSSPTSIPSSWMTDASQRAKLASALAPLFARYDGHPRILAWEVFNEPEWDIWNSRVAKEPVQATVREIAASVHANSTAYVTVGSAMLDGLPMWVGQGLDFYQAHWYDYMASGNWCARCTDYATVKSRYNLDAPLVIGEFYAGADTDAYQRFEDWYSKGYAGGWPWSIFSERTSDKMAIDLVAAKTFAALHSETQIGGTGQATPTPTPSATPTPSPSPSPTPTLTPTPTPTPTSTTTPTPTPSPTPTTGTTAWAFWETFDGTPSSPLPYSSTRFDIVAGANDPDGIIDGQTVDLSLATDGLIEAGHGLDCGAPIGRGDLLNNHNIIVDFDPARFQVDTRPHLVYICNNHLMTAVKSGYGVVSLMPRQLFDWAGRTGTVEFEVNVYGFGREWWDVYIVPEDEMLLEIVDVNEGGSGEQMPKRAVRFSFREGKPSVALIDNYKIVEEWRHWQTFSQAFPSDPAISDPRVRRTVRLRLSQNSWGYEVQKADGTSWTFSGSFSQSLSFSRGLVRIEHHSYNPSKDGIFGQPWSQYTYHWDNIRFDGPIVPARTAYEAGPVFVDLLGKPVGTVSERVSINVGSTNNPRLIGHIYTRLHQVDPTNSAHWMQVRVNGGPWTDMKLRKPVDAGVGDRSWSTIDTPLTGLVVGQNILEFRYNARPSNAEWREDGFRLKDLEIQVDDRKVVSAVGPVSDGEEVALTSAFICTLPTFESLLTDQPLSEPIVALAPLGWHADHSPLPRQAA